MTKDHGHGDFPGVLIVDDDPLTAHLIRLILDLELKITTRTASNGVDALAALARHPVPVVVTDLRMPRMSGLDLLKRVKELYPATEVIVLSTSFEDNRVTPEELIANGAMAALAKDEIIGRLGGFVRSAVPLLAQSLPGVAEAPSGGCGRKA